MPINYLLITVSWSLGSVGWDKYPEQCFEEIDRCFLDEYNDFICRLVNNDFFYYDSILVIDNTGLPLRGNLGWCLNLYLGFIFCFFLLLSCTLIIYKKYMRKQDHRNGTNAGREKDKTLDRSGFQAHKNNQITIECKSMYFRAS